jgi:hypothetical protein
MPDWLLETAVVIACVAFETFILSIGWNLAITPLFAVPAITIPQSAGLLVLLKLVSSHLRGKRQ